VDVYTKKEVGGTKEKKGFFFKKKLSQLIKNICGILQLKNN
jgi:hypothetical protein